MDDRIESEKNAVSQLLVSFSRKAHKLCTLSKRLISFDFLFFAQVYPMLRQIRRAERSGPAGMGQLRVRR